MTDGSPAVVRSIVTSGHRGGRWWLICDKGFDAGALQGNSAPLYISSGAGSI